VAITSSTRHRLEGGAPSDRVSPRLQIARTPGHQQFKL
jgi:hypothetical protein